MEQFQIEVGTYLETKEFECISLAIGYAKTLCYQRGVDWARVYYGDDFTEYVDVTC
jgi:hypothetical protein